MVSPGKFIPPFKFKHFLNRRTERLHILDIGCGNHSPSLTKRWFPNCSYTGVDSCEYNNGADDFALMDRFVKADLEKDSLDSIPDKSFDLIIAAHVVEHLHDAETVIQALARKLKPNGLIYIECPTERSKNLPSGVNCLNFYDDPSHVRIYDPINLCSSAGLRVIEGGIRRDPLMLVLGLTVYLPKQVIALLKHRKLYGPTLWDLLGFAQYAIATPTDY